MSKVVIGLTGGIGTGKSTVADLLANYGADVVSGDELGREVVNTDMGVRRAIVDKLGQNVVNPDSTLNRRRIAESVFGSPETSSWLTQLTFPGIYALWNERRMNSTAQVVVLDAALIFEWGIEREFDVLLIVAAPPSDVAKRASGRFSPSDLASRADAQWSEVRKIAGATHVITNDGTLDVLKLRVSDFWTKHIQTRLT